METVLVVLLILILMAILLSYAPRVSETNRVIIFVVVVLLTLMFIFRGHL